MVNPFAWHYGIIVEYHTAYPKNHIKTEEDENQLIDLANSTPPYRPWKKKSFKKKRIRNKFTFKKCRRMSMSSKKNVAEKPIKNRIVLASYLLICFLRSSLIWTTPSRFAFGKVFKRVSESNDVIGTTAKKKLLSTWEKNKNHQ